MTPRTSKMLAGALAVGLTGAGAAVFSALTATANPFVGPFSGGSGGSVVRTGEDLVRIGLGEDVSFGRLTVAGDDNNADAITILSGRLRFAPSTTASAVLYWSTSNGFNVGNQWNMCDGCYIVSDNYSPKRASESSTFQGAHGVTLAPQSAVDACAGAREGQLTTLTTDGRLYQCDGTTNHRLAGSLSGSAALDFPNLTAGAVSSALTVTVTGAAANEGGVRCNAAGSLGDKLQIWEAWTSANDTVSIRLKNHHGADAEDLDETTFHCTIVR